MSARLRRTRESLAPLRERRFRLRFSSEAVSVFGDFVAPLALTFAVLDLTGSARDLGFVMAARTLAIVVFLLAGGVWADRMDRKVVMVIADAVRFLTQAALAALLLTGDANILNVVLLQFANGAATGFYRPATTGLTPQTVSQEHLQEANALLSLVRSIAGIAGPVAAGILVATVGSGWAIAVDATTFAVSGFLLSRIELARGPGDATKATFFADLRAGWGEVVSRQWLWLSILAFMSFHALVIAPLYVLGPVIAERQMGGAGTWAAIAGGLGVGSVLGDFVALRWHPQRPLVVGRLTTLLVVPLMVLLAQAANPVAVVAAAVLAGAAFTLPDTLWYTVLQSHVPPQSLSRVSSYDWMGSSVLRPLGYAIAGPLGTEYGNSRVIVVAVLVACAIDLAGLAAPSVRRLARAPEQTEPAPA